MARVINGGSGGGGDGERGWVWAGRRTPEDTSGADVVWGWMKTAGGAGVGWHTGHTATALDELDRTERRSCGVLFWVNRADRAVRRGRATRMRICGCVICGLFFAPFGLWTLDTALAVPELCKNGRSFHTDCPVSQSAREIARIFTSLPSLPSKSQSAVASRSSTASRTPP